MNAASTTATPDYRPWIAASWTLVGIPLAYGLYNAVSAALQLFTG